MKLKDFKKGCNSILSEAFEYPVYGQEVLDGYKRPAFFTELLPRTWKRVNRNMIEVGLTYKITFLEKTHGEAECLSIVDAVSELYGWTIKAADKTWVCEEIDHQYIGTDNNILQISIDFANIRVVTTRETTTEKIEGVLLDLEIYSPNHELMGRDTYKIT